MRAVVALAALAAGVLLMLASVTGVGLPWLTPPASDPGKAGNGAGAIVKRATQ
jgi:hypothetical protein